VDDGVLTENAIRGSTTKAEHIGGDGVSGRALAGFGGNGWRNQWACGGSSSLFRSAGAVDRGLDCLEIRARAIPTQDVRRADDYPAMLGPWLCDTSYPKRLGTGHTRRGGRGPAVLRRTTAPHPTRPESECYCTLRCMSLAARTASYSSRLAATATFSESPRPCIGIRTTWSQRACWAAESPTHSLPSSSASGRT